VATAWTGKDEAFQSMRDALIRIMNGEPADAGDDIVRF
jgi:hypothetical protein